MDTKEFRKTIEKIVENYKGIEKSLVHQLLLQVPQHGPTIGSYRENVWRSLFRMIIPKKYQIEQGVFIIDSKENISKEVDLAVFDEMYTPYLFNYGEIKFIPIEAVSVVIQCKSKISSSKDIENWVESIDDLETSLDSVARLATHIADNKVKSDKPLTQTATRPIKILCATDITGGFEKLSECFDILLYITGDRLKKEMRDEKINYLEWNAKLNHVSKKNNKEKNNKENDNKENDNKENGNKENDNKKKEVRQSLEGRNLNELRVFPKGEDSQENVILSLTFQLNQLLMLINNPMLFPHRAYAGMFSEVLTETKEKEGKGGTDERK